MDNGRFPQLIAFDLDYTLWNFWIDTHVEPPLKQNALTGVVYDSANDPTRVEFFKDVPEILRGLKSKPEVTIAAASRTAATKLAREALQLIRIPVSPSVGKDTTDVADANGVESLPANEFFDHLEIYPGSKIAHFKQLHKVTGIPYSEMLFFDDETRNEEVEKQLGVTFVWVVDGLNWDCFQEGLREWRKRRAADSSASS
ncbi:magnesium-dependent phosphatase-1 [Boletus edulis]|uniref:Magnesium-dependent phosphatase-1 n=1 Tax=Boletus edulis BED1 TaxID=1328754 RepID=A0AAD4BHN4_BOLED|nr:magnesium-dependent phosphatase-1 [Boletus edulis]KAF8429933.1 magnesium-dependent phosphatase-1 [Boletus edulis BED1]